MTTPDAPAKVTRRAAVLGAACLGLIASPPRRGRAADEDTGPAPPLARMIRHSLLVNSLYRHEVSDTVDPDGAAGANRSGFRFIEEQRQGAEWIVRGIATSRPDWIALGWGVLDWGVARQGADGGFGGGDAFHSASFFVEALARACLIDRKGATAARVDCVRRGSAWLMRPDIEDEGARRNRPFAHRRFLLAAALGQSAVLTNDEAAGSRAERWAEEGLALQRDDGANPERGGFDAGYQMAGVLFALRYLTVCANARLRGRLRVGVRRATTLELGRLGPDGGVDAEGSTRILKEKSRAGKTKDVPYGDIIQALVFGALALPAPEWLEPAERIGRYRRWFRA